MDRFHQNLIASMWLLWAAYWWVLSRRVKVTERQESIASRLSYAIPVTLGFAILWSRNFLGPAWGERFLPGNNWRVWAGFGSALTCAGLLFTIWARAHLGRNWSGTITIKEGHELISSGPYSVVRHPIYTGLLLAAFGQAVARGQWLGLVGVAFVFWGFWLKLRIEERWMRQQFGGEYETYCRRVSALVPFIL